MGKNKKKIKILSFLRGKGKRRSKVRDKIIDILTEEKCLLNQKDLVKKLAEHNLHPNRSTIFRELVLLVKNNLIVKNNILGLDYYELPEHNHHHLICLECQKIQKFNIADDHLQEREKKIIQKNDFQIKSHIMDFYGYCKKCQ